MILTEHTVVMLSLAGTILGFFVTFIEVLDKHDEIILIKSKHDYSNKEFLLGGMMGLFFVLLIVTGMISEEYFMNKPVEKLETDYKPKEYFTWGNLIKNYFNGDK